MAANTGSFVVTLFLATSLAVISFSHSTKADDSFTYPPLQKGLSFRYYKSTCPQLESIVSNYLKNTFKSDIGAAAGLLRLHFHDCFVQGCDASVLLDGSASGPSEQVAPPNLTLRPSAFKAINEIRALIDKACGRVVSCADVVALAARDSVALSGGPNYNVPLGRRDSLNFATQKDTLVGLPAFFSKVTVSIQASAELRQLQILLDLTALNSQEQDDITWRWSKAGVYKVKSAYLAMMNGPRIQSNIRNVWLLRVPPRVKVFGWLLSLNRLLTVDNLIKRGCQLVNRCVLCRADSETANHLFDKCPFSLALYSTLANEIPELMATTRTGTVYTTSILNKGISTGSKSIILIAQFVIWRERCARTFTDGNKDIATLKDEVLWQLQFQQIRAANHAS